MEPDRLRLPPDPARAGPAAVVLPVGLRGRCLHRRDRDGDQAGEGDRRRDHHPRSPGADPRTRPRHRALPPPRLVAGAVHAVGRPAAPRPGGLHTAVGVGRRDGSQIRVPAPAHLDGPGAADPQPDAVTARALARLAAAAAAAVLDALAHRLGSPAARTVLRFGTTVVVLGIARASGVSSAELGLGRRELGGGARTGAVAGTCAAAGGLAGAAAPATRRFFLDDRAAAGAVFGWLRLRSGSVLAPLLAHAALNDSALVAGRAAHWLSRRRTGPPG